MPTESSIDVARENYIATAIQLATKLRQAIRNIKKNDPSWTSWDDDRRIQHMTSFEDLNAFYMRYPIIARYMICLESYSSKAFVKFLHLQCAPFSSKDGEDMQHRNLHLQAKYLQFLWEETRRRLGLHFSATDAHNIYEQAFKSLTDEDTEFKAKYKKIEEDLAENRKNNNADKVRELLAQLRDTGLPVSAKAHTPLQEKLLNSLLKQHSEPVLTEPKDQSKFDAN